MELNAGKMQLCETLCMTFYTLMALPNSNFMFSKSLQNNLVQNYNTNLILISLSSLM